MPVKQAQSVVFLLWVHTLHVMESMYPQQKHKERHTVNKATWERNRLLSQTAGSPHVLDSMSAVIQGMTMFGWGGISIALEQCCFFSDLSLGKGTFEETKFHHTPNTEQLLFHGLAGLSGFIIDSLAIMDSSVHSPCGYFEVRLGKLGKLGNQILAFPKKKRIPKWMVYNGKPYLNSNGFGGPTPIFRLTPICLGWFAQATAQDCRAWSIFPRFTWLPMVWVEHFSKMGKNVLQLLFLRIG